MCEISRMGGGTLGYLAEHREEVALWERYNTRVPTMSELLIWININLAQIGQFLQAANMKETPSDEELIETWNPWVPKYGKSLNTDEEQDEIKAAWGDLYQETDDAPTDY